MISTSLPAPPTPVTCHRLTNGLTVIHHDMPFTSVATVDVWVKAGAIAEPDEWIGMAHFLEHMIFKGSENLPPGMFDAAIEQYGGNTNAATGHDYAHFFITTAAQHLPETLPYLADILLNPAIPEDEFDRERDVVLEEIRQTADNPDWVAFQALSELTYQRHAYGRPILGTEDVLRQRSPAEMRQFHHTHYQPENMTVVVVGNISQALALELVNDNFSQFPSRVAGLPHASEAEPPITGIRRQELGLPRLEQARLMLAWHGPGIDSPLRSIDEQVQAAYGLDVLSIVLAEGRTSRLVKELREERHLVQGVSSGFALQKESGLFTISAWLEPEHLERVEAIICDRLAELAATPITAAELARCKCLLQNDHAFSTETPCQLAGLYGYYSILARPDIAFTYPERVQTLEADYLQSLANQYLSPCNYVATLVRPL